MFGSQSEECGYVWGQTQSLYLLGKIQISLGDNLKARNYLEKCQEIQKRIHDTRLNLTQDLLDKIT